MNVVLDDAVQAYNEQRWDDAIGLATQVLDGDPDNLDALEVFGLARFQIGQTDHAITALEFCVERAPGNPRFVGNLGELYRAAGRLDDAVKMLTLACQLQPGSLSLLEAAAMTCLDLGEVEGAIRALSAIVELQPEAALVYFNLAEAYRRSGQFERAVAEYDRAIALDPSIPQMRQQRALALLAAGDYAQGWPAFESRLDPLVGNQPALREPRWEGAFDANQRVFVYSDQGVGDAILFSRYLPHLAGQGVNLVVEVPASLIGLMRSSMPNVTFIELGAPRPSCDWQIALGSLPLLYGTTADRVPDITPYLTPSPEKIAAWERQFAPFKEDYLVGIRWAGNPDALGVQLRNATAEQLIGTAAGLGSVTFVNLQFDQAEAFALAAKGHRALEPSSLVRDFEDTAAVLSQLDLVISVDTSVLNLAGALNVPAWGLLNFAPEWRWYGPSQHSRWYPSVRTFCQDRIGNWSAPLAAMRSMLLSQQQEASSAQAGSMHTQ